MLLRARHYATAQPIDLSCAGGTIQAVAPASAGPADRATAWVAPPLFHPRINGADRHSFISPARTPDAVRHVVDVCRGHGIGGLCPTLVTAGFDALAHGMATLRRARDDDPVIRHAV